jgi:ubiquinone/menaquinone biosynthesis C-methylase UbiE
VSEGVFDVNKAPELDSAGRIRALKPLKLLREGAGIREGETAVDFGSGTGTFALPLAGLVGEKGRVYAVDRSPEMMAHLRAKNPPANIVFIRSDVEKSGLEDGIADVVLMMHILHEVEKPGEFVTEAARILKPGGRLVVLEWRAEADKPPGPPRRKRISWERLEGFMRQAGLSPATYTEWTQQDYVAAAVKREGKSAGEIEAEVADLKARWPAHSVPPSMWQQLEDLEEELERARKEAAE